MKKKIALFLFILYSLICLFSAVPESQIRESLGSVTSVKTEPDGILFDCQQGQLKISHLGSGLLRIQASRTKAFDAVPSFAVLPQEQAPVPPEIISDGPVMKLTAGGVNIEVQRAPLRVKFLDSSGQVFAEDAEDGGVFFEGNKVLCRKIMSEAEHYYGFGEKTGTLDKRGQKMTMWNTDQGYGPDTDPLYQSIPFFMALRSGKAFGIFFDNTFRSEFDMGHSDKAHYSFSAEGGDINYYFIPGPRPADVLKGYTKLTGPMPLPPLWALGYQQSRYSYLNTKQVRDLAFDFKKYKFPVDVIYLDIHYMDSWKSFTWHPKRFPDPEELVSLLDSQNIKLVTIIDPGIKIEKGYSVHEQGLKNDYFSHRPDGSLFEGRVWPGNCNFPDFLKPEVREWWGSLHGAHIRYGVSGIWNDMNEPSVWSKGLNLGDRIINYGVRPKLDMVHGSKDNPLSHDRIHNVYGLLMDQATYDGLIKLRPDERPFILSRAGYAGIQRLAAVWTGDNSSNWDHLSLSIPMVLNLGLSGVAFAGADIGGFAGSPSNDLFARWISLGAFYPFCRNHTSNDTPGQEPWAFGNDVLDIGRRVINLRYSLMPYTYSLFAQAHFTGAPVMRPMIYEFPDDERLTNLADQFLWGPYLLVAPVVQKSLEEKTIILPKGRWIDFQTDREYKGPGSITVKAGLDTLPILVRKGAIIPQINSVLNTGLITNNSIQVDIFPEQEESSFVMYEDDGHSLKYRSGEYLKTVMSCLLEKDKLVFRIRERTGTFRTCPRNLALRFHGIEKPVQSVAVCGEDEVSCEPIAKYTYNAAKKLFIVEIADNNNTLSLTSRF